MFASQIYNIHLTIVQYILVMISATIASLGVAGVPGSGLIVLSIVVKSVGLPMEADYQPSPKVSGGNNRRVISLIKHKFTAVVQ